MATYNKVEDKVATVKALSGPIPTEQLDKVPVYQRRYNNKQLQHDNISKQAVG
jgi:hypothetical protein